MVNLMDSLQGIKFNKRELKAIESLLPYCKKMTKIQFFIHIHPLIFVNNIFVACDERSRNIADRAFFF